MDLVTNLLLLGHTKKEVFTEWRAYERSETQSQDMVNPDDPVAVCELAGGDVGAGTVEDAARRKRWTGLLTAMMLGTVGGIVAVLVLDNELLSVT